MTDLIRLGDVMTVLALANGVERDDVVVIVTGIDNQDKILQLCFASVRVESSQDDFQYPWNNKFLVAHPSLLLAALPEHLGTTISAVNDAECERLQDSHIGILRGEQRSGIAPPTQSALEAAKEIFEAFEEAQYGDGLYTYFDIPEQLRLSDSLEQQPSFWLEFLARKQPYNLVASHAHRMVEQLIGGDQEDITSADPRLTAAVLSKFTYSHISESMAEFPANLAPQIDDQTLTNFYEAGVRTIEELTTSTGVELRGRLIPGTKKTFLRFRKLVIPEAERDF